MIKYYNYRENEVLDATVKVNTIVSDESGKLYVCTSSTVDVLSMKRVVTYEPYSLSD